MRTSSTFALLIVCLTPLSLLGEQQPAFRATVEEVEVTVIASGAKGLPVSGLKAADFRVWDNGKEQAIAGFDILSSRAKPDEAKLPANTYSNRIGNAERPLVISMILLDAINTRFRDQATVRHALERILEQIQPDERVAIFGLGRRFQVIHDFSSDKASLLAKLKNYKGEMPFREDLLENFLSAIRIFPPPSDLELRPGKILLWNDDDPVKQVSRTTGILATVDALEAIANYAKDIPGRKNLLWVSGTFPLSVGQSLGNIRLDRTSPDFRSFEGSLDRGIKALNNANVSVYTIDARGLLTEEMGDPRLVDDPRINVDTIKKIAKETGGTAFYQSNDFDRGLRAALDDSREVYVLTYSPKSSSREGSYHSIRVRTSMRGVQLRYRSGYYTATTGETSAQGAADRLVKAMSSPLGASGIGLRVSIQPRRTEAEDIGIVIQVDAADLNLTPDNATWTGKLRLEVIPTGATSEQYAGVGRTVQVNLTQETYQRALAQGLRLQMKLKPDPAAIALRVGVLDERGGRVGALVVPLASAAGPPSTR